MAKIARQLRNGWFASEKEYLEKGFDATIYKHVDGIWTVVNTGKCVPIDSLPEPADKMWPIKFVQR